MRLTAHVDGRFLGQASEERRPVNGLHTPATDAGDERLVVEEREHAGDVARVGLGERGELANAGRLLAFDQRTHDSTCLRAAQCSSRPLFAVSLDEEPRLWHDDPHVAREVEVADLGVPETSPGAVAQIAGDHDAGSAGHRAPRSLDQRPNVLGVEADTGLRRKSAYRAP